MDFSFRSSYENTQTSLVSALTITRGRQRARAGSAKAAVRAWRSGAAPVGAAVLEGEPTAVGGRARACARSFRRPQLVGSSESSAASLQGRDNRMVRSERDRDCATVHLYICKNHPRAVWQPAKDMSANPATPCQAIAKSDCVNVSRASWCLDTVLVSEMQHGLKMRPDGVAPTSRRKNPWVRVTAGYFLV
jgi:hypothetical protein